MCLPKDDLIKQMIALLNNQFPNAVNEEKCRQALNLAYKQEAIKVTSGMVYTCLLYTSVLSRVQHQEEGEEGSEEKEILIYLPPRKIRREKIYFDQGK